MKTASFFTFTGAGRVSIARFAPRRTPAGFRCLRSLAPGEWFNSVSEAEYIRRYRADILGALDPKRTWDQLHTLANGAEPVLLCWEKPEDQEKDPAAYCHRAIVAAWFEEKLGEKVEELLHLGAHPLLPMTMRALA